jgi:hypothetical protein
MVQRISIWDSLPTSPELPYDQQQTLTTRFDNRPRHKPQNRPERRLRVRQPTGSILCPAVHLHGRLSEISIRRYGLATKLRIPDDSDLEDAVPSSGAEPGDDDARDPRPA